MSEDRTQKRIEFIIEQQAQFVTDIQQLKERQEADAKRFEAEVKLLKEKHNHLTEALTTVVGMIGKLAAGQERTDAKLVELAEAQKRTDTRLSETDERLNVFITVVERFLNQNGNGRSDSDPNNSSNKL